MKTNLLAQNDNLVIENLKADVGKSVEPLSNSVTFPIDVDGAILPICCIETLPSDSFEISVECLLRQLSSLKVPLMTNLRLNTAFYYCDNRLAWKKWDRFMTGGRSGNEVYDIPRVYNQVYKDPEETDDPKYLLNDIGESNNVNLHNTLHTYFGISMNTSTNSETNYSDVTDESEELPLAFPFFGYQMICRDYYTNVDRLPEHCKTGSSFYDYDDLISDWAYDNLFPSDDDEIRLVDGIQQKSGFDNDNDSETTAKGMLLDKVRYHDVRDDYFTTSKKAPMRGDAPQIGNISSSFTMSSGQTVTLKNNSGILKTNHENSYTDRDYFINVGAFRTGGQTNHWSSLKTENNSDHPKHVEILDPQNYFPNEYVVANVEDVIQVKGTLDNNVSMSGTSNLALTAQELRLLSQLTVWQELNMLHKPYYNDFLNAHFDNVRVGESPVEKPIYIGGTSQLISINEILQTSATTDTSALGTQGATAMSIANNFVGRYYCNNYGYIIGVAYIIPDILYKPAMPRGFSRRTKEDYYSPEFANLSMQATLNKEIFFSNNSTWNNQPWGYTGAYDELRSIPNRIAGDLLNPSYTDLQAWVLTRSMDNDNLPAMNTKWLSLKDNVDKTAWNAPTMPAFMLQAASYIKAVRPMPKIAIPKAL